ncbi:hypothetical protein [Nocardioides sp. Arc9.136]|uniref:hypothetical protein n=1 Tax=Nocardioides sp. Arc9.136 TaxID=2996826 RepID=UPI002665F53B|nr:hypothetical protein [Nocardioides sp. Arc9.136]WKN47761.1 hypothetical protein OSR43_17190 [Nocardioides sp. Arc9.136]
MTRLLLAAVAASAAGQDEPAGAPGRTSEESPAEAEGAIVRLARALRDAGHEVVHAGQGLDEAVVVAAAVQEDVQVVVLLAPPAYDASALATGLAGGTGGEAAEGIDDDVVAVVLTTPADAPGDVLARLEGLAGVADDTPYH